MILTLLKNIQNKALALPEMQIIFKKEAVFGNVEIENWNKCKQVTMRNDHSITKCMKRISLIHVCKESTL